MMLITDPKALEGLEHTRTKQKKQEFLRPTSVLSLETEATMQIKRSMANTKSAVSLGREAIA